MFDATLLQGKRILVTGGGTGLGKEMAVGFAAHGAHVYICGRRKEVLDLAVTEIRERSRGQADALIANVRDPDSIEAMMIGDMGGRPAHRPRQQCRGQFPGADRKLCRRGAMRRSDRR